MTAPAPGSTPAQAAFPPHDQSTCGECQSMIARGGHRIIDLLGHAGYWAYAQHHEAPPWSQVHQAWAQAASTITSAWDGHYGPLDTFDTWAEARGYRNEFARDYDHDDLVAAFAAGAHAVAIAAQQPQQGRPPRTTGLPGMDRLRQKAGVLEYTCGICGGTKPGCCAARW